MNMNEKIERKIYSKPKVMNMDSIAESIGVKPCKAGSIVKPSNNCREGGAAIKNCNSGNTVLS